MNESMKTEDPASPKPKTEKRGVWKTVKGQCRTIKISRWKSQGRYIYQINDQGVPLKTTTSEKNIVEFARILADTPGPMAINLSRLNPALLASTALAIQKLEPILRPLGISVAAGVEEYAAVKEKAGTNDLRDLFNQFLSNGWFLKSKTPIDHVVGEFLNSRKSKAGVSAEYQKKLHYTLKAFVEKLGGSTPVGAITIGQLKDLVFKAERSTQSTKTCGAIVRTFFRWCQRNGYLDGPKPTAADQLERIALAAPVPRILTVAEAKAVLSTVQDPWCLLYLVLVLNCIN